ncbi:polysaccharide deacetylase family protein [bacterium]|nr:polysaccharide deacetylase family protein [bacterium]
MKKHNKKIRILFILQSLFLITFFSVGSFLTQKYIKANSGFSNYSAEKQIHNRIITENDLEKNIKEKLRKYELQYSDQYKHSYFHEPDADQPRAASVPILLYHAVRNEPKATTHVSVVNFIEQMMALKRAGYQTITLSDYVAYIKSEIELPENSILLTFDDGRKDSFYPTDEVLEYLDFNAVIFVLTNYVGSKSDSFYLSASELDYIARSGRWEIQPHGHIAQNPITVNKEGATSHYLANKKWLLEEDRLENNNEYKNRIENDLNTSAGFIADKTGLDALGFAFPFGNYGQLATNYPEARKIILGLAEDLFDVGFYQTDEGEKENFNIPGQGFLNRRIIVNDEWSASDLMEYLNGKKVKKLPYEAKFNNQYNWINSWGKTDINKTLSLSAKPETNGGFVFLNNALTWNNYEIKTKANLRAGNSFSLVAYYLDADNYLSCNYSLNGISLKEKMNGQEKTLLVWNNNFSALEFRDTKVNMLIDNERLYCGFNNSYVLRLGGERNHELTNGSIGFKVWDENPGTAFLEIKNLNIFLTE